MTTVRLTDQTPWMDGERLNAVIVKMQNFTERGDLWCGEIVLHLSYMFTTSRIVKNQTKLKFQVKRLYK